MKISKYYWFVIASGIISGLIVFGGQVLARLGFSLFEITTLPYILPILILAPVFLIGKPRLRPFLPILLLYGFVEAGIVFCQFAAPILGASVAITLLLLYVQPLWTTIGSRLFLKEKITKTNVIACTLVLAGVLMIVNPFHLQNGSSIAGIILALLGGIFLSGWVSVGSILSKKGVKPTDTMFIGSSIMLILLFSAMSFARAYLQNTALIGFSFNHSVIALGTIIFFGLITFLANHYLYLLGTKKVSTASAGIIMLLEPIVGAILATIFFHQVITIGIVIGGIMILFANYLVIKEGANASTD